jgi:cellulose synthase/poly-beta-1,6-N-acetylglucosamine synthase-like glycosyltransferase
MMPALIGGVTTAVLAVLALYGLLGLLTLALYLRHRGETFPAPAVAAGAWPLVTVQLPVYNERYVVERLIAAALALDYPRERLQIQVIDDSDDETAVLAAAAVLAAGAQGHDIQHVRRDGRAGYKAGALAAALPAARGEFIAIFDADFQPAPDFLRRTVPHFLDNPRMGMIQARWGHLNAGESALTAAQSIALDKHFIMEQTVRHRANLFPKFNGAGGIWRAACISDAGGWQADTVCEDLCLSTRAVLRGWQFLFLNDVIAPAELPASIQAYKSQQARWAKGSTQCFLKYSGAIAADRAQSRLGRAYALLTMSAYATQGLLLLLLLLQIPLLLLDVRLPAALAVFTIIGLGQPLLFILAQQAAYPDWARRLRHVPTLLLVAIGTAPNGSRAVLQAFGRGNHPFVRTPKGGAGYRLPADGMLLLELLLAAYAAVGLFIAWQRGSAGPVALLLSCLLGFGYVAWLEVGEMVKGQRAGRPARQPAG